MQLKAKSWTVKDKAIRREAQASAIKLGLEAYAWPQGQQRIFNKNTNCFTLSESAFHYLFCLKFSFKLVTFCRIYARKQK